MKRRRQMLGLIAACALVFTGTFTGYADPVTYDYTDDSSAGGQTFNFDAGDVKVFPGDKVYGSVKIYLGAENAAGGTAEDQNGSDGSGTGYWVNTSASVYSVSDVTPQTEAPQVQTEMVEQTDEAGNTVYDEAGNPVMVPVTVDQGEVPAPQKAFQLDTLGYVIEVIGGTSSGASDNDDPSASSMTATAADGSTYTVDPDAKYYAEGAQVTLTADPAADGQQFAGWKVQYIDDDGNVKDVSDVGSLGFGGLSADTLSSDGLTFTMGRPGHVLVFSAQYAAAAQDNTGDAGEDVSGDGNGAENTSGAENGSENASGTGNGDENASGAGNGAEGSADIQPADDSGEDAAAKQNVIQIGDDSGDDSGNIAADSTASNAGSQDIPAQTVIYVNGLDENGGSVTQTFPSADNLIAEISTAASTVIDGKTQVFDKWVSTDENIVIEDPTASSTKITAAAAPAADANVNATYKDASAEQTAEADVQTTSDSNAQTPADPNAQTNANTNAQTPADPNAQTNANTNAQTPADPNAQTNANTNAQTPADPNAQTPTDPNAQTPADPNAQKPADQPAAVYSVTAVGDYAATVTYTAAGAASDGSNIQAGTEVKVSAAAQENKKFTGWTASGIDLTEEQRVSSDLTFTMPAANVTLTPGYEDIQYSVSAAAGSGTADQYTDVTVSNAADGSVLYSGRDLVAQPLQVPYGTVLTFILKNTTAKMNLIAKDGTTAEIAADQDGTFSVTVKADLSLVYTAAETYQVTVNASQGTVNGAASGSFISGTTVNLHTDIPAGNTFAGWTIDNEALATIADKNATDTTLTIAGELTASGTVNVTANFKPVTYNLTVVDGSGTGQYATTTPAAISADAPEAGYRFSGWTLVAGSGTFADKKAASTTFTCSSDAKVQANYELIPYKITVKNGKTSGTYTIGQTISLEPNFPASGKEFDKWSVTSGKLGIDDKGSYYATATVKASDATVTALYKNGPSPDSNTITGLQNDMEYLKSTTLTFNAVGAGMDNQNPNPGDYRYKPTGYQIGSVTGSWNSAPYQTSMAINAVGDYTLTVTYAREVFDGANWNADGTTDSKSITIHVVNTLSVKTGDNSPIIPLMLIAGAALAAIIILVVLRKRRRR